VRSLAAALAAYVVPSLGTTLGAKPPVLSFIQLTAGNYSPGQDWGESDGFISEAVEAETAQMPAGDPKRASSASPSVDELAIR
jgi:hypothetical protein